LEWPDIAGLVLGEDPQDSGDRPEGGGAARRRVRPRDGPTTAPMPVSCHGT